MGLLKAGDSIANHERAIIWANQIRGQGWASMHWLPISQHFHLKLLSVLYVFLPQKPYVYLPVHALFFSLSCVNLYLIGRTFQWNRLASMAIFIPLILSPISWLLISQLQRDPFVLMGTTLFVLAFTRLLISPHFRDVILGVLGILSIWIVKSHLMGPLAAVLCFTLLVSLMIHRRPLFLAGLTFWVLLTLFIPHVLKVDAAPEIDKVKPEIIASVNSWAKADGLPDLFDWGLHQLALTRQGFILESQGAGWNLKDMRFLNGPWETIRFFPKSLLTGVFAPFPNEWAEAIQGENSSWLKKSAVIDTIALYIFYLCFFFYFIRNPSAPMTWIILFCLSHLFILGITQVNIGTLMRLRFSYVILLAGLGLGSTLRKYEINVRG